MLSPNVVEGQPFDPYPVMEHPKTGSIRMLTEQGQLQQGEGGGVGRLAPAFARKAGWVDPPWDSPRIPRAGR